MVPNGWTATQIEELADFKSGGTPSKKQSEYWGGDEPWISGKDLKSHYLSTSIDKLTDKGFCIAKKAPKGASLILVRGMTLLKDFPVGYATKSVAFNQDIKALIAKSGVDGLFLSFLLAGNKTKIKNLVTTAGHGTGRLDTETLKEFPVNLPPLSEQIRIAEILSTWDKAIAATEKLIETSKQQKKALMQQLLTGKKRLVNPETGKTFEGDWEEERFEKLFNLEIGGTPSRGNESYWDEMLKTQNNWLSIADLKGKYISKTSERISDLGVAKSNVSLIPKGTIVMSFKLTIGRRAFLNIDSYTNEAICALQIKDRKRLDNGYLYQALEVVDYDREIDQAVKGRTLNKAKLKRLLLPLPTLTEQQKIASVLTAADKEIEVFEAKLAHFKQEKKALMQQLLTGKRRVTLE